MTEQEPNKQPTSISDYRRMSAEYGKTKQRTVTTFSGAVFTIRKINPFRLVDILSTSNKGMMTTLQKYQAEKTGGESIEDMPEEIVNDITGAVTDDKPDSFMNRVICAGVVAPLVTLAPTPTSLSIAEIDQDDRDVLFMSIAQFTDIEGISGKKKDSTASNGSPSG